ncbi:MAG TPA: hypothetical protein VE954_02720 [Oligoflexus sp.]|uniref:hypothetical protein n=1 Tax=Oligoflexus sp. TaxID=1971216 RepID=UPI002D56E06D|nr:hypothetical protein [Oligoflexus sp.]HYX31999.1 hypothetical protein [Oligoflexus sp.]
MLTKLVRLSLAALSLAAGCTDSGGSSAGTETAPTGDPTAAYGEITADDAKTFVTEQLGATESIASMGISPESAAKIKDEVGVAPADGQPALQTFELRARSGFALADSCTSTLSGTETDADLDYLPVDRTYTYDCAYEYATGDNPWSWKAKGSWSAKDSNDAAANTGGRYEMKDYEYSGSFKNENGDYTYSGKSDGYTDWKKDATTFSTEARYATEFKYNDKPLVKMVYLSTMSFVEDTASVSVNRQGILQMSGYVRTEREGKVSILEQKGEDLVVDSALCNYSGYKTGKMTFTDAKGHKLVVTYQDCKRVITLDEQTLPTPDENKEPVDARLLSCKSFSAEGDNEAVEGGELIMYSCENLSIDAAGVTGMTDEKKMAYLKDICVSGRGQGANYRTVATVGRLCPKPEKGLGYACLNTKVSFYEEVNTSIMGNKYTYWSSDARQGDDTKYLQENCEYPYVEDSKGQGGRSTEKVGTFVAY